MKFTNNRAIVGTVSINRFKTTDQEVFYELVSTEGPVASIDSSGDLNTYDTFKASKDLDLAILRVQSHIADNVFASGVDYVDNI